MGLRFSLIVCVVLLFASANSMQAGQPMIELRVGKNIMQGKSVAHDASTCWLMDRTGQLSQVTLNDVDSYRALKQPYRAYSATELRTQLYREFGRDFEVKSTGHYLVVAASGNADRYAELFEDLYRSFHTYFSTRGFKVKKPEFPMVAIVFPDRASFYAYCRKDGFTASKTLMGYYQPNSNRVALFDQAGSVPAKRSNGSGSRNYRLETSTVKTETDLQTRLRNFDRGAIDADLEGTIIHEATHQVAFNTGLHARIGENPRWVVEGLAMAFESPGNRSNSSRGSAMSRANKERFVWFQNYLQKRRKSGYLKLFVSSDDVFGKNTLDAYSEAWALTFFLLETRSSQYAKYLKKISERPAMKPYLPEQRADDFIEAFSSDWKMLEADYLRFITRLK